MSLLALGISAISILFIILFGIMYYLEQLDDKHDKKPEPEKSFVSEKKFRKSL